MIPIKDNIPAKNFPLVSVGLIVMNVLVFLYEITLGEQLDNFIMTHAFIPARFALLGQLHFFDLSRFLPMVTSMFLHNGLFHLLSNVWMLWVFGDNVEDAMGRGRYLAFYLICGVVAVLVHFWSAPDSPLPMLGASGAVAGVLGAYFLLYPKARILTLMPILVFFWIMEVPAYFFLGAWFLMQFLQATFQQLSFGGMVRGGVAWWAHIGGFGAGMLLVHIFRNDRE
jgi:membrane associated rhomboid family serine protease